MLGQGHPSCAVAKIPSIRAMQQTLSDLSRFAIPGSVAIIAGAGGIPFIRVATPLARAEISLLGAHVTSFQPAGHSDLLWMSALSQFSPGKPIRGGIPLCWPWFGPHATEKALPGHGFVRLRIWELKELVQLSDGRILVRLTDEGGLQAGFDHAWKVEVCILIGTSLEVELATTNPGQESFKISEALHTYFAVGDARQVSIQGLTDASYIDKMDGGARKNQGSEPIRFASETDAVYQSRNVISLCDPVLGRQITITKRGSASTVVWNPWIAKSKAMPDFGDSEWTGMACIEAANCLDDTITLPPGSTSRIATGLSVAWLDG